VINRLSVHEENEIQVMDSTQTLYKKDKLSNYKKKSKKIILKTKKYLLKFHIYSHIDIRDLIHRITQFKVKNKNDFILVISNSLDFLFI